MDDRAEQFAALISDHLTQRPGMQPRDIYKLLYQGVRGPEHLIASAQEFTERLSAEWEALDLADQEALSESIRPDGSLLRLNLRPYKAAGGGLKTLAEACLETGLRPWGTQVELELTWQLLAATYSQNPPAGLLGTDFVTFTHWLQDSGYPAVHHSDHYRKLYRPAYRLVASGLIILESQEEL